MPLLLRKYDSTFDINQENYIADAINCFDKM